MKIKNSFISIVIFLIVLITIPVLSQEKMRIAILDLKADGVSKRTARAISNMIRNEFINIGKFTVIERAQMDSILKEQGLQQTGCTDSACAVQLGKLMSTRKILIGEVMPIGKSILITVRIIDVEKGVSEFAAKEKAPTEDQLDVAASKITSKLASRIRGVKVEIVKKEEPVMPAEPVVITSTGYYLRGIVPGWGQVYAGSNLKGYIIMGGFTLTAVFSFTSIRNFQTKKDDYESLEAGLSQDDYDAKYSDYEKAGTQARFAVGLFLIVYIYNWVDLVFLTTPEYGKKIGALDYNDTFTTMNTYSYSSRSLKETRTYFSAGMRF